MEPPPQKRRREEPAGGAEEAAAAVPEAAARDHVLLPYRAVGSVVGAAPPAVFSAGKDSFAVCSVGKTFHEYNLARMTLAHVSPAFPKKVRAVAKTGYMNIAAAGGELYGLKVRRLIWTATHSKHAKVQQLLVQGDVLLSLASDNTLKVFRAATGEHLSTLEPRHDSSVSVFARVRNYRNKVVLGTHQGTLELWNFNTATLVHKFPSFGAPVTALCASPADDTIGVGLANGRVLAYNLAYGKELFCFTHAKVGGRQPCVTAVAFRNDGPQALCSGTEYGEIAVWNLQEKRLEGLLTANLQAASQDEVFEAPHTGRVTHLQFLDSEPVLVTAGADNALKMYVFDGVRGTGKLLRERRGHYDACGGVRFFDSKLLLSYAADRTLRVSHVFTDVFNREVSQGAVLREAKKRGVQSFELRLPQITCLAASTHRTHEWGSVVTGHKGSGEARTWRMDNFTITAPKKKQESGSKAGSKNSGAAILRSPLADDATAEVTAVAVSRCANYGLIGLSTGRIHVFNLQSGNYQGCYADHEQSREAKAHDARIVSLHLTQDNSLLLSSGADNYHKMWSFPPHPEDDPAAPLNYLRYRIVAEVLTAVTAFNTPNCFLAVAGAPDASGSAEQCVQVLDMTPRHLETGMAETIVQQVRRELIQASAAPLRRKRELLRRPTQVARANVVRDFAGGHRNVVTCMEFSNDSRLLFSASIDAVVCVWDLPTDRLVDVVRFASPVTSLSVHPDSYFLATTHANDNNVYLWTNKVKYGHIPTPIHATHNEDGTPTYPAPSATSLFRLPEVAADGVFGEEEEEDEEEVQMYDPENPGLTLAAPLTETEKRLVQLTASGDAEGLVSLSALERTRWTTLFALDQIKKRNKPIAPPKKIDAPFFLPSTVPGSAGATSAVEAEKAVTAQPEAPSRIMSSLKAEAAAAGADEDETDAERAARLAEATQTPFLRRCAAGDYAGALELLSGLGVSKVDLEFRGLADTFIESAAAGEADEAGGEDALAAETARRVVAVLRFFEHHLARRTDFEFVQAALGVFLRHCGLHAVRLDGAKEVLQRVELLQKENAHLLTSLVDNTLCLMRHFVAGI